MANDKTSLCTYWLNSEYFAKELKSIPFRPCGLYAMKFKPTEAQLKCFIDCCSEAPLIERLSSLASAYYIFVGIAIGIFKIMARQKCDDWPYIPISLSWTIPVIYKRAVYGRLVFKDVSIELGKLNNKIIKVEPLEPPELTKKRLLVGITGFLSIVIPWFSVIIALLALLIHLRGEASLKGHWVAHIWFCFCGIVVGIFLVCFCLLSDQRLWWVNLFGNDCDNSSGCITS
ncbi:5664_t:CDS:2 [Scutellospora calospora]|uniref:5664_t:CDS:1 n=1 Tax=Scutellospora calospora TaxID=85575 RepID=A0ACA9JV94_9GLOM|nr:5664_t:CDS:2 [Scutellospora calospora]